jgi:hypothetical protein
LRCDPHRGLTYEVKYIGIHNRNPDGFSEPGEFLDEEKKGRKSHDPVILILLESS